MTALERIVDALRAHGSDVRETGSGVMAQCPAHPDRTPSLSIGINRDGDGVVVKCFGQHCDYRDIVAAVGLTPSDLFDTPRSAPQRQPRPPRLAQPAPGERFDEAKAQARVAGLTEMWGDLVQAGRAVAQWRRDTDPWCRSCGALPAVGGPQWWRLFCADCLSGWAPLEAAVDIEFAALGQASRAVAQAWQLSKRRRGRP